MTSENPTRLDERYQTREFPTGEFSAARANPENPHVPDVSQSFPGRYRKSTQALKF